MKTNVLIVDQALEFGGSIVSTANLIRGIDREKYNIVFLSSTNEDLIRTKLRELGSEIPVVIARKRLHYNNTNRLFGKIRHSKSHLLRTLSIGILYGLKLLANAGYMFKIAAAVKKYNIDLVQLNNGMDDEVTIACKPFNVRQVVYFRGYVPLSRSQKKFFIRSVAYFFAVSEYIRQVAIDDGVDPDKVIVATPPAIPEHVDASRISRLKHDYRVSDDETTVGIFGRIISWKGQKEFLIAAQECLKRKPNLCFFIIGETTDHSTGYYNELLRTIEHAGIGDRVVFTGYVENIYDYYEMMDIVVHASTGKEPSGRVIFEAMSQGTPVIASTFGGPREFIEDGVDGFLVNPYDHEHLAKTISSLAENEARAKQIGQAAQAKIEKLYSKRAYAKRIEYYYAKIFATETEEIAYET